MMDAIYEVERELVNLNIDSSAWHWTLTFLESKPVVELDDGTRISFHDGTNIKISRDEH